MNRFVLLMPLALLGGCNVHSKNPANDNGQVTINADENGSVAFNLPFVKGEVKVPSGFMHNGNFDIDGVKLMPGSSMTAFTMNGGDHGANMNATFTAPAAPEQVRSYFVDQFRSRGVEVALTGDKVSGTTKDGSAFTIQVSPAASGSTGNIVIQGKD